MNYSIAGTSTQQAGKPKKRYQGDRECKAEACVTILSTYNKGPFCYNHQPIKRPRLRGKMPSEKFEEDKLPRCASCGQSYRWRKSKVGQLDEVVVDGVVHREGQSGYATLCELI